uniref:2OG-FeII_Oxy_2 domain-containing protein n=1 Tax=Caenorhabditis tropicalis TaxID=1561998 RepID=A0A1I7TGL0_9PELO
MFKKLKNRDFITEEEEKSLLVEVEPHMKRLRYEKSHWDDAIHLYREREQRKWAESNLEVISRIRTESFGPGTEHLTYVHILDLHKDGVIKPHIDSIRYCGDVITGVSLLSDAIMRLRHKDRKEELILDLMMPRRSLYRLGGPGRYDFTHEVLADSESTWNGEKVPRGRRVSIICRDIPKAANRSNEEEIQLKPIPEEI